MTEPLVPYGISELQLSFCENPAPGEIVHVGHFGLFNEDSMPLCLGYVTADQEWVPDQMKTGYAQAMWQMRMEGERRAAQQHQGHNHPTGVPEGAQAIEVTPEMSKKILEMLKEGSPSADKPTHQGMGGYL